eukprot:8558233-Pyramimonas_sp.AAC.1
MYAAAAAGAFGGAPYVVTKRCIRWGGRMRLRPLGPSVRLHMGPRSALTVLGTHAAAATGAF